MNDKELRNAMAESGFEMTYDELALTKESIVRKLAPHLLDAGMTVDEALTVIVSQAQINE